MDIEHTALIVPAMTDQAGQCRIVAQAGRIDRPLVDYRTNPDGWADVGVMDSRGNLVACKHLGNLPDELKACEPLNAGLVVSFQAPEVLQRI